MRHFYVIHWHGLCIYDVYYSHIVTRSPSPIIANPVCSTACLAIARIPTHASARLARLARTATSTTVPLSHSTAIATPAGLWSTI